MGCGASLMVTMRVCPSCGGKTFSASPPSIQSQQATTPLAAPRTYTKLGSSGHAFLTGKFEPAGNWQRIGAYFLDALILAVAGGLVYGLSTILGSQDGGGKIAAVVGLLIWVAIPYIYFTICHSSDKSATWGKSAFGIMLITDQGEKLTRVQAFVRVLLQNLLPIAALVVFFITVGGSFSLANEEMKTTIGMAIIFGVLFISLGPFVTVFFNDRHQTLFDLICKTRVIKKTSP
jgi:uncharacterized RDD family membrane protein YckC